MYFWSEIRYNKKARYQGLPSPSPVWVWHASDEMTAKTPSGFPYKKDRGARRKFWKEPLRGSKTLLRGRGWKIPSPPRGTYSNTKHLLSYCSAQYPKSSRWGPPEVEHPKRYQNRFFNALKIPRHGSPPRRGEGGGGRVGKYRVVPSRLPALKVNEFQLLSHYRKDWTITVGKWLAIYKRLFIQLLFNSSIMNSRFQLNNHDYERLSHQ